ncbi:MAG: 4'-phosphopantetheinyl transferase [Chlamydiales bacterium]
MTSNATLEVVVLATPNQEPERPSRERVAAQSRGAREALSISAELSGAGDAPWEKDHEHVPLSRDGWHWSISHDAWWSVAIVGRSRVGIDVERIERRRGEMVEALIAPTERRFLTDPDEVDATVFARVWTAKEAVLKSVGIGLGALSRCVLVEPLGPEQVMLEYAGERCLVRQRIDASHVLSIHTPGDDWSVRWHQAP